MDGLVIKITNQEVIELHDDYEVFEIEKYSCDNKQELEARETLYILNNECVNLNKPCSDVSNVWWKIKKYKLNPPPSS